MDIARNNPSKSIRAGRRKRSSRETNHPAWEGSQGGFPHRYVRHGRAREGAWKASWGRVRRRPPPPPGPPPRQRGPCPGRPPDPPSPRPTGFRLRPAGAGYRFGPLIKLPRPSPQTKNVQQCLEGAFGATDVAPNRVYILKSPSTMHRRIFDSRFPNQSPQF